MGKYKKIITTYAFTLILSVVLGVEVFAAPPLNWDFREKNPNVGNTEKTMSAANINKLKASGAIRLDEKMLGVIAPTENKILVIRVGFADKAMAEPIATATTFMSSVRDFYSENSYGLFTASSTVSVSSYTLLAISNYNDESVEAIYKLLNDTINAANPDIDFSQFDHVMIYHAGFGEEMSGVSADIWSMYYPATFIVDYKTFVGFTIVPESAPAGKSSLGVICHEYGHQLALPDLYDTSVSGGQSICGTWSLMDYPYGYDNKGSNPSHLDSWCKDYLGYIDLTSREIPSGTNAELFWGDIETSQTTGFYKIPIEIGTGNEYFIVEYREPSIKINYDLSIPATGLAVWHIDDTIARNDARLASNSINIGIPNLAVELVCADNTSVFPPGEPGDVFKAADTFTTPQSNSYTGVPTGITLAQIVLMASRATASIASFSAAQSVSFSKIINYPNPAGQGYSHPKSGSGIITTIVFKSPRPPIDLSMTIYNLVGEKVLSIPNGGFTFQINKSDDYDWVYEYDWNGKNQSGDDVPPGLYLYRIRADSEKKAGKLAIVR
ncbi:M6 family metalloprotease domain-containing protein [Elusimicrobiota bacterium]